MVPLGLESYFNIYFRRGLSFNSVGKVCIIIFLFPSAFDELAHVANDDDDETNITVELEEDFVSRYFRQVFVGNVHLISTSFNKRCPGLMVVCTRFRFCESFMLLMSPCKVFANRNLSSLSVRSRKFR